MVRAKKKADEVEQVHSPDFALAVRIFRQDIKPAQAKVGEYAQEQSEAYKAIKKRAYVQPQAARLAFRLDGMEEAKRDDFLRCFNGLLKEMNIFMPVDLVDAAEGKGSTGEAVVPAAQRSRPKLVTVPTGPEADDLLESAAGEVKNEALAAARSHLNNAEPEQQAAE